MLNTLTLVGRIKELGIIEEKGIAKGLFKLAVQRPFKNIEGEYECDIIEIMCFGNISTSMLEHCQKDDLAGVKGRLQVIDGKLQIIAEKVTFLSRKKEKECCSQCGEEITKENQGESELALQDNICKYCMEDGYGK